MSVHIPNIYFDSYFSDTLADWCENWNDLTLALGYQYPELLQNAQTYEKGNQFIFDLLNLMKS